MLRSGFCCSVPAGSGSREGLEGLGGGRGMAAEGDGGSEVGVRAGDVVRVVLQWCAEAGLEEAAGALARETGVALNAVPSLEGLLADVLAGRWDAVLEQARALRLPRRLAEDLYEQVVREMAELGESDAARSLLRQTNVMATLRARAPERFARLEALASRAAGGDNAAAAAAAAFPPDGLSKEQRRAELATALSREVAAPPPSRLLTLIGQALQWQRREGLLAPGEDYDLFTGSKRVHRAADAQDARPNTLQSRMNIGDDSSGGLQAVAFTPDGRSVVTACNGFVEVWDVLTGRLRTDLPYQAEGELMLHAVPVLCLNVDREGSLVAAGDESGDILLWRLRSGRCVRTFKAAHASPVTAVAFGGMGSHILSGSALGTVSAHGVKSGRKIKDFVGHVNSPINSLCVAREGSRFVSADGHGDVCIWDARTFETVGRLKHKGPDRTAAVSVALLPSHINQVAVLWADGSAVLATLAGQTVREFAFGDKGGAEMVGGVVSPQGKIIYALDTKGVLRSMETESVMEGGNDIHTLGILEASEGASGLQHHAHMNLIGAFGRQTSSCILKIWAPQDELK